MVNKDTEDHRLPGTCIPIWYSQIPASLLLSLLYRWAGLVCQGVRPGARTIGERVLKVFGASTDVEALEVPQVRDC